jgi:hypothetical protein
MAEPVTVAVAMPAPVGNGHCQQHKDALSLVEWLAVSAGLQGEKLSLAISQCREGAVDCVAELRELHANQKLAMVLPQAYLRAKVEAVLEREGAGTQAGTGLQHSQQQQQQQQQQYLVDPLVLQYQQQYRDQRAVAGIVSVPWPLYEDQQQQAQRPVKVHRSPGLAVATVAGVAAATAIFAGAAALNMTMMTPDLFETGVDFTQLVDITDAIPMMDLVSGRW